jgi:hypothetical protein
MKARISVGIVGALIALTISLVAFAGTPGAVAVQGQAILAGQNNTATNATIVLNTDMPGQCTPGGHDGLAGCGQTGLVGWGSENGVFAYGPTYGVEAQTTTGTGVFGFTTGSTGIGVWGRTGGVGSAVYGEATANGAGVFGDTTNGTGVQARSTNGPALNVLGRAQFSGSGIAVVQSTKAKVTVNNVALTNSSFILATIQFNVPGTWVRGVSHSTATSFTIWLNKAVADTTFVGWFIVD